MKVIRIGKYIFPAIFWTILYLLLSAAASLMASGIERTVMGGVRLVIRKMDAVFPRWKDNLIAACLLLKPHNPICLLQIFPVKITV